MSDDNDFPELDGGWCDGLGCSGLCWCGERLAMKEEFQRVFNKPWKQSYDENPDIDCDRVDHLVRFSTSRVEKYYETEMQKRQGDIDRLKEKLAVYIVIYPTAVGMRAKRCEDWPAVNQFIRESDFSVDDCKVISDGLILTQDKSSRMWFYKKAEQK